MMCLGFAETSVDAFCGVGAAGAGLAVACWPEDCAKEFGATRKTAKIVPSIAVRGNEEGRGLLVERRIN